MADHLTRKEYWKGIDGIVESVKEAVTEHGEDLFNALHETVDGHNLIIYYANIPYVLAYTEHIEAIMDHMGEIPAVGPKGTVYDALMPIAYWAIREDVFTRIDEAELEGNPRGRKKKTTKKRGKKKSRKNPGKPVKGVRSLVSSALK